MDKKALGRECFKHKFGLDRVTSRRGGYSNIFIHTSARTILLGLNIEFQYLEGMKILWIFFVGHQKIGRVVGVNFMFFKVFS